MLRVPESKATMLEKQASSYLSRLQNQNTCSVFFIGQTQWNETAIFGPNSTVLSPLLKIPDIDRDGVSDFLVFAVTGEEVRIAEAIGSSCLFQRSWPHSSMGAQSLKKVMLHHFCTRALKIN